METLHDLIDSFSSRHARPALGLRNEFGLRKWSYAHLHDEIHAYALHFQDEFGLKAGNHLVLWGANSPEWVAAFLGATLIGVVVVPADADATADYVDYLCTKTQAVLIVHGASQTPPSNSVSSTTFAMLAKSPVTDTMRSKRRTVGAEYCAVLPDDTAVIIFTSGTVSEPKGVVLTHANLVAQMLHFRRWRLLLRVQAVRMLVLSPLSHVQGLILGLCAPLSIGVSVIYSRSLEPVHVIRTIRQNRISLLVAVPRLQHLIAETLLTMPYFRSGLSIGEKAATARTWLHRRYIMHFGTRTHLGLFYWALLVGGARLPAEDEHFWFDCGYYLAQGYGLTETAAIVSYNLNTPFRAPRGSIGQPVLDGSVRLSEDGEILVRGATISPGYFGIDNGADMPFTEGDYLKTGDMGRFDLHGRLYFVGRKKEIIVTGEGHNVYPNELESVLNQQRGVREAVVIGLERDGHEEPHAVLLLTADADGAAIMQQANARLTAHQMIRGWTRWPTDDFPRTSLLKVKRRAVREKIAQMVYPNTVYGRAATNGSISTVGGGTEDSAPRRVRLEDILATSHQRQRLTLIAQYVVEHQELPDDDIASDSDAEKPDLGLVDDLGLGSLDVAELMTLIEQRRKQTINQIAISPQLTLAELRSAVQNEAVTPTADRLPAREPLWSRSRLGDLIRKTSRPLALNSWAALYGKPDVFRASDMWPAESAPSDLVGDEDLIIAAAPHRHWLDGFLIYWALPRAMRHKLMTVTNLDFSEFFAPAADTPMAARLSAWFGYYIQLPLIYRYALLPGFGKTREGLYELGFLLDRGYLPITFPKGLFMADRDTQRHDQGIARLAIETQRKVLPVWINGNDEFDLDLRQRQRTKSVYLGQPIAVAPTTDVQDLIDQVEEQFMLLEIFATHHK